MCSLIASIGIYALRVHKDRFRKSLKIPNGWPEPVGRKRTDNTMSQIDQRTHIDIQYITQKNTDWTRLYKYERMTSKRLLLRLNDYGWTMFSRNLILGKTLGNGLKCCLLERKHVSKQMGFSQNISQYLVLVDRCVQ